MHSVTSLARPFAMLLPEWLPAEHVLSSSVDVCSLQCGRQPDPETDNQHEERIEKSFFERMPGYALFRSLTQRLAGKNDEENVWKPALAEIEEALVPAFIIEELEDGRFTGFRALGAHALRGSRLYPHPGAGASSGSPFH